jgi:hypothetical protein
MCSSTSGAALNRLALFRFHCSESAQARQSLPLSALGPQCGLHVRSRGGHPKHHARGMANKPLENIAQYFRRYARKHIGQEFFRLIICL